MGRLFKRYIGIDYSGAKTPVDGLGGLRVYRAAGDDHPTEVKPSSDQPTDWTRKGLAHWLVDQLAQDEPTLVGIDHGFSFPQQYFEKYRLKPDWPTFLDDFQYHWPTDRDDLSVHRLRKGSDPDAAHAAKRSGETGWRRLTEQRSSGAKSVFHFDVPGQVASSTHAGIPWLRFMRRELGKRVHFWPFDGWDIPQGVAAIAEVYPALWSHCFTREDRTSDQHDAYCVTVWLSQADRDGRLAAFLAPNLTEAARHVAPFEGWILGVSVC